MRKITQIVVHCSASAWGTRQDIDKWHKARGFTSHGGVYCGYHRVICGPFRSANSQADPDLDGTIQMGREDKYIGAHAAGHNAHSLGVCLIGPGKGALPVGQGWLTRKQWNSLLYCCRKWMREYGIPVSSIVGHRELPGVKKACPGFDVAELRKVLKT